jgi:hypothetical protein
MLDQILNLLPESIVSQLAYKSLANLQARGAIKDWSVDHKFHPDHYHYLGLGIKLQSFHLDSQEYWNWYVYDGLGVSVIKQGTSPDSDSALVAAKQWIDHFHDSEPLGKEFIID